MAKGIRNASSLMLTYGSGGLLTLRVENTLALQQPSLPEGSNSTETLNGGWPAYEFSDGSASFRDWCGDANGDPAIRLWSQSTASTPNRLTVEFQDEFNEYQQDSLSLVDVDDALLTDRQVTAAFAALGLPNFDQATRMLALQLNKTIDGYHVHRFRDDGEGDRDRAGGSDHGHLYKRRAGAAAVPGGEDSRRAQNYQTVQVTAQWHDDAWYTSTGAAGNGTAAATGRRDSGSPRPLVGSVIDAHGIEQFGITETDTESADGSFTVKLSVAFVPPASAGRDQRRDSAGESGRDGEYDGRNDRGRADAVLRGERAGRERGGERAVVSRSRRRFRRGRTRTQVTLSGFSFSAGTAGFNVYRGLNPTAAAADRASVAVAATLYGCGSDGGAERSAG